jgi:hypothetical protein
MVRPVLLGSVMTESSGTSIHTMNFGVGALRHSHAIVIVLRFPVGVFDNVAVGIRTAEAVTVSVGQTKA